MGQLLRSVRDRQLFLRLGFVRLGDYVVERLGLSLRTAQELIRVEEILTELPRTAAAWLAGEITTGHVRLLSRVATGQDEELWVARAMRMDVRALGRAVAAALERAARVYAGEGAAGHPAGDSGRDGLHPAGDGGAAGSGDSEDRSTNDGVDSAAGLTGGVPSASDDLPELVPLSIRGPAWLLRWWHETLVFVRQLAGSALAPGSALEVVLSESADLTPEPPPSARLQPAHALETPERHIQEDPDRVARETDARLRELATARQRAEAELADQLACLRDSRGYLTDGSRSLESYARRRLGLSPRRMYYLLALDRTLRRLPDLRRAFVSGRLTLKQALLVGRVAERATTSEWVRRAERITLRRLDDEVTYWELLRSERPEVWERLRGGPLPEGIVLVPGKSPRLRASAQRPELSESASYEGDAGDRGNHSDGSADGPAGGPAGGGHADGSGSDSATSSGMADLHAPARDRSGAASAFLEALEASEAETPLPWHTATLCMRVDPDTRRQYDRTIASLRSMSEAPIEEWEAFVLILRRFWKTWDNEETRGQRRRHKTLERDGWRCTAAGCRSIGTGRLQEHHIVFRSEGGAETDPSNVTSLCTTHHGYLLHAGMIRCRGTAPDGLTWELGVRRGLEPFLIYHSDVLVTKEIRQSAQA